jgi:hypothetical protein
MHRSVAIVAIVILITATIQAVCWPGQKLLFSGARSLIVGVILGSNLRPYQPGLVPSEIQSRLVLAAIMHHASLFCTLGWHTHAVDPSVWIGVRELAVQRVWS